MDILTNGEVSDTNKWNRMSVIKVTTAQMNNLTVVLRQPGVLVYNRDVNDLLVNKGSSSNPKFKYLFEEIGSMELYGGDPDELFQHWKICNGQSLSIADYPDLYAIIGTTFGNTGSTHFNIPDYRNKFPRGSSNIGGIGGSNVVTLTTTQMPAHTHTYINTETASGSNGIRVASSFSGTPTTYSSDTSDLQSKGGGSSHENKPPYLKLHMIIKVQ